MSFDFTLPTTGAFSFTSCIPVAPARLHGPLAETGAQRGRLRDVLKRSKRAEDKDILSVLKIIEDYIPYLFSVEVCIDRGILILEKEIVTSWRCTILESKLRKHPRVEHPTIYYEIAFVLLTYAYALVKWASSLSSGEDVPDIKLNQAADFLCRAAGTFHYVYETVLPKFYNSLNLIGERELRNRTPVDISREVVSAHYRVALADAQMLAVYRAQKKSSPSPSLMARICVASADHLSAAQGILASTSRSKDIDNDLIAYVSQDRELAEAFAFKWMGSVAEKAGRIGEAISCLEAALALLTKLNLSKLHSIARRAQMCLNEVEELHRNFKKYNDSVTFEIVPPSSTVKDRTPSGRDVLQTKAFAMPKLKFGDKVDDGDYQETMQSLSKNSRELEEESDDSENDKPTYAGKGSYY